MSTHVKIVFASTVFERDMIRSAVLTEEFHPLSLTVPVSYLEVELFSEDARFSIIDPSGDFTLLQHRQPLTVIAVIDGTETFVGRYYLDTWENLTDNLIKLTCVDELGLLDTLTYRGGIWLEPITMGALLAQMFTGLNVDYEIDPDLETVPLTGWIPICSYREALQQIAFAAGAYILCARQNGVIKFGRIDATGAVTRGIVCGVPRAGQSRLWKKRFRPSQWGGVEPVYDITHGDQSVDQKISLRPHVTGVELSMHDITVGTAKRKLFEGVLSAGTHEIQFSQPMHTLSVTGDATIVESGANYAILDVASEGTFLLEGLVYNDSITKIGVYAPVGEGVKKNILTISEASLVNSSNGPAIAQRVFDYYQKRHQQEVKLIRPRAFIGSEVLVETLYGRKISGMIEKMVTDLAGGYVGKTTIVGTPVAA